MTTEEKCCNSNENFEEKLLGTKRTRRDADLENPLPKKHKSEGEEREKEEEEKEDRKEAEEEEENREKEEEEEDRKEEDDDDKNKDTNDDENKEEDDQDLNNTKPKKSWAINANKKKEEFRNYENNPRKERVENFYKLQHSKMTYEFVMSKREEYLSFNKCEMTIWDMLKYLNEIVDDSDPDTDLTQVEHALQSAQSSRYSNNKEYYNEDEYDWLHVTCLIHDLGKILAIKDEKLNLKGEEQWCVVGDNFPVGCKFDEANIFYDYFKNNSDYSNPKYNTKYGIYSHEIGLNNIIMSWGHDEYMYNIMKSQSKNLPIQSLYMVRFHSFYPWHTRHAYFHLCNQQDLQFGLKWVNIFNTFDLYSKSHELDFNYKFNQFNQDNGDKDDILSYYKNKVNKYFPVPVRW